MLRSDIWILSREIWQSAKLEGAKPITQTINSNAKPILEQQRYFFENLWTKAAVHADQRMRELEEGVEPEFFEVINEKNKAAELLLSLSKLAKKKSYSFCQMIKHS